LTHTNFPRRLIANNHRASADNAEFSDRHVRTHKHIGPDPGVFAEHVVRLLQNAEEAEGLARRARADVVAKRDMRVMTEKLVECYRAEVARMRSR